MSITGGFDFDEWLRENSSSGPTWYDDRVDPDYELRQSRPVDIRRVRQLALKDVENQQKLGQDTLKQESAVEWTNDDEFDFGDDGEEDENAANITVYGSMTEEYNPNIYSEFSKNILIQMGYDVNDPELFLTGRGLGKDNNGIAVPVQGDLSRWGTTAGLGAISAVQRLKHTYKKPEIELKIPVVWIPRLDEEILVMPPGADQEDFTFDEDSRFNSPSTWCGLRVKTISYTDSTYCPLELQLELFGTKSEFDDVGNDIFLDARNRSNPYELLKKEYFQNRAALKMAELDAECGHIFTNPVCYQLENKQRPATFYWGDVCAGPGGFSEFMSTVVKWKGKGFGFTLKAENDFQLDKFNQCATPQTFQAFYGDGTGDVTRTANLISYSNEVFQGTGGKMLHVMMADGGFSVAGKENYQELLSRQLMLCQCTAALLTLRKGGVCVIKMFDNFLRFTIDCIYLMRLAFEDVAIVKPHQSRPANSERYLVCKGLRQQGGVNHPVAAYMLRVNDMMNQIDPLHQQSGLVQNAETKPLMFLSAGILAGAQFDGNRDVDADGNIIDVSEQIAIQAQQRLKATEDRDSSKNNKRSRRDFELNGASSSAMNAGSYNDFGDDGFGNGNGSRDEKDGPDGSYDDHYSTFPVDPDGEIHVPDHDDEFAIEYLNLPSVHLQEVETRCFFADEAIENKTIEPGFNKYGDWIPPEPHPDRDLLRQQQKYASASIYTDKYKNEEKKKKLQKQQGKILAREDAEQYTVSMKDIVVKGQTIHSLVPLKYHDKDFAAYILEWNQSYALQQTQWLKRVLEYIQDPSLPTDDQERIRIQCLQRWKIVTDQKNESGDGMVHWSPIWGRLWTDPGYVLQTSLKSNRLITDLTNFIQQLTDKINCLRVNNTMGSGLIATDQIVTSSVRNQAQIQAALGGGQSMSSFTNLLPRANPNSRQVSGMNNQHAVSVMSRSLENVFGANPRFLSQFTLYLNFCKFVYYNTYCIDMSYALKLIGLDLQYLPFSIRLKDISNREIFQSLRSSLRQVLVLWFRYINKQRPILTPPAQPPLADDNVVLESRTKYGTSSTNWAVLPISAQSRRCIGLTISPDKRHAAFNRTFLSAIFPHRHLLLTSPASLTTRMPGLHLSGPGANYKQAIHPLLAQILTAQAANPTFSQSDPNGDCPSARGIADPTSGVSSLYHPVQLPKAEPFANLDSILRNELNLGKDDQCMKQDIQHDISTGLMKFFPGDMIFDCFVNLDVPPPISSAYLSAKISTSGAAQQEAIGHIAVPTPRFRSMVYDAWSLPHQTTATNPERYMYERLPYTDRFENLRILGDTLRIKEPSVPLPDGVTLFQGQDIKTQKLLHHSRHLLSQRNRNRALNGGQRSTNTLSVNQLTNSTLDHQQFPSTLEITRAYDLNVWMKQPIQCWNFKADPTEPSKDNLYLFQKGHKMYSLSIWLALFSVRTNSPDDLLATILNGKHRVHQLRVEELKANGMDQQSPKDVMQIYQILKDLQQKAICDAMAEVWLPPQKR